MKTLNIILVVLGINLHLAFGSTVDSDSSSLNRESARTGHTMDLSPVTPREATFEETESVSPFEFPLPGLAPTTPNVAEFTDMIPELYYLPAGLAPAFPKEADFEDSTPTFSFNRDFLLNLNPVTPFVASFDDTI